MTTPAQIQFPILAPTKAVESPDRLLQPNRGDEAKFDHFLDREVNQPHLERTRRKERPEAETERNDRAAAPQTRSERRPDRTDAAQRPEPDNRETAVSEETGPRLKPVQHGEQDKAVHEPLGTGKPAPTAEEKLVKNLKELNIDQDRIQTILDTIRKGPAAEKVMDALAGLLGALVAAGDAANLQGNGAKEPQTLAALLQQTANPADTAAQLGKQHEQVVNVLVEAGLTREQAQKLLTAARQGNLSDNLEDIRIQLARATEEGSPKNINPQELRNPVPDAPKERAASAQLPENARPGDNALQKLTDLIQGRGQESNALHNPDANTPAQHNPTSNPLLARSPVPQVLAPVTPSNATAVKVDSGGAQPVGSVADNTARAAETARPALPESYTPRGLGEKPVTQQIIDKFAIRSVGQQKEIFIKLDPPSLGTVRMNVSTAGDHVKTTLVAENHAVKQTIESNLAQLKDALQGQGVKVDSFTVLVGGNPGQGAAHQRQEGMASRFFGSQHGLGGRVESAMDTASAPARAPRFYYPSQSISVFA